MLLLIFAVIVIKTLIGIIIPLTTAVFIALLCLPLAQGLEKKFHVKLLPSAILCLITIFSLAGLIILLFTGQLNAIGKNFSSIVHNIREQFVAISIYAKTNLDLDESKSRLITGWLREELLKTGNFIISAVVVQISEMMINLLLIPVYVFLMLIYRNEIKTFLVSLSGSGKSGKTIRVIKKACLIVPHYLGGLVLEMIIVSTLSMIGFLVCGVPFPFFLGFAGGLLNMIPYVGNLIAGSIAMMAALAFSNNLIIVFAAFFVSLLVQLIDNNFVLPKLVASRVNINPLVAIIVILIGGALAGDGGMFLALPTTALIKIMCDESKEWRVIGLFIGNQSA